jgi:ABC-2 type transport system permease protein
MHNLGTVIWFELTRTLKKKTFWLSIMAFPVLFAAILGLSYISNKSANQASERLSKERFTFVVVDESRLVAPELVQAAGGQVGTTAEAAREAVRAGNLDAAFIYPSNPSQAAVRIYAKDAGLTKNEKYQVVAQELLKASIAASVGSPEKVALLQMGVQTQLTTYDKGEETKGLESAIAPGIFLILFYALIVLLGNQMLTSTTEEKENRVVEMILTTVSARALIIGKIITMLLLGAIQVLAIAVPLVLGYLFFRDTLNIPSLNLAELVLDPVRIVLGGLFFGLGFMLFTGILVAIGSAMPTAKEAGGFFGFAILVMFAPLYALGAIVSSPEQLIVQVFSYFPITAPITMLLRNAVDNLSLGEALVALVILAVSAVLAVALAIRTFQSGSLRYHNKLSLREVFALGKR